MTHFKLWDATKKLYVKEQLRKQKPATPNDSETGGANDETKDRDASNPQNGAHVSGKSTYATEILHSRHVALSAGPTANVEGPREDNSSSASGSAENTAPIVSPRADGAENASIPDGADDDSSSGHYSRIFALVVAIDDYQHSTLKLNGCIADAEDFATFLEQTLRVPTHRIVKLYNNQATRANILDSITGVNGLIGHPDIERGDPIVIFYAGHGSQGEAPASWAAENNQFETICPYDVDVSTLSSLEPPHEDTAPRGRLAALSGTGVIYGIPDRTFNGLMRRLAFVKGDNLLVVLDCCHSGGMMRKATTRRARAAPVKLAGPVPEDLDEDIWSWRPESNARAGAMVLPTGFADQAMASHVLLAACQPGEQAEEDIYVPPADDHGIAVSEAVSDLTRGKGNIRGVFTSSLLAYLRVICKQARGLGQLTYGSLMDCIVRQRVSGMSFSGQNPLCQGLHRDRLLFTTNESPGQAQSFTVERKGSSFSVSAGAIHGIVQNTRFILLDPAGATKSLPDGVPLLVDKLDALECTVRPEKATTALSWTSLTCDARAVVEAWNTAPMKLHTTLPVPTQGLRGYTCVQGTEYYDVSIKKDDSHWFIYHFDPLTIRFGQCEAALDTTIAFKPANIADVVARWMSHLYRFHTPGPMNYDLLPRVVLRRLQQVQEGRHSLYQPISDRPEEDMFYGTEAATVSCHPLSTYVVGGTVKEVRIHDLDLYYGLTLYNDSVDDLFPYIFYFDPARFAIKVWYHPPKGLTRGPLPRCNTDKAGELAVGYGVHADALQFTLSDPAVKDVGYLKIFVSTSYVDLKGIEQAGFNAKDRRDANQVRPKLNFQDAWAASVYTLTCCGPRSHVPSQTVVAG